MIMLWLYLEGTCPKPGLQEKGDANRLHYVTVSLNQNYLSTQYNTTQFRLLRR